jgi:hypothetical protein
MQKMFEYSDMLTQIDLLFTRILKPKNGITEGEMEAAKVLKNEATKDAKVVYDKDTDGETITSLYLHFDTISQLLGYSDSKRNSIIPITKLFDEVPYIELRGFEYMVSVCDCEKRHLKLMLEMLRLEKETMGESRDMLEKIYVVMYRLSDMVDRYGIRTDNSRLTCDKKQVVDILMYKTNHTELFNNDVFLKNISIEECVATLFVAYEMHRI